MAGKHDPTQPPKFSREELDRRRAFLRETLVKASSGTPACAITDNGGGRCLVAPEKEGLSLEDVMRNNPILVGGKENGLAYFFSVFSPLKRLPESFSNFSLSKTGLVYASCGFLLLGAGLGLYAKKEEVSNYTQSFFPVYANQDKPKVLVEPKSKRTPSSSPIVVASAANEPTQFELLAAENAKLYATTEPVAPPKLEERLAEEPQLSKPKVEVEVATPLIQTDIEPEPVVYSGKLDIDGKGNLEYLSKLVIYKSGRGKVYYKNMSSKEFSEDTLNNFLIGSIFESSYMQALGRKDLVDDKQVLAVKTSNPNYLEKLRDAMIARGIYTKDKLDSKGRVLVEGSYRILDPNFKRLDSNFKGLN